MLRVCWPVSLWEREPEDNLLCTQDPARCLTLRGNCYMLSEGRSRAAAPPPPDMHTYCAMACVLLGVSWVTEGEPDVMRVETG